MYKGTALMLCFILDYRTCYSTEFPCRDRQCLPNGMLCDGVANCLDGSDEDNCGKSCIQARS